MYNEKSLHTKNVPTRQYILLETILEVFKISGRTILFTDSKKKIHIIVKLIYTFFAIRSESINIIGMFTYYIKFNPINLIFSPRKNKMYLDIILIIYINIYIYICTLYEKKNFFTQFLISSI